MVAPWLLVRTDPAIGGLVKNGPPGARCGGMPSGTAPSRTAGAAPDSLDQWSRPSWRAPGARPESPIPMPSRSARPAGNRHSCGDSSLALLARHAGCLRGCGGVVFPGRCCWRLAPLEAASPLGTLACGRCPECQGGHVPRHPDRVCQLAVSGCARFRPAADLRGDGRQHAQILAAPGKRGRGRPQPGRVPGAEGFPALAAVAPIRRRRGARQRRRAVTRHRRDP